MKLITILLVALSLVLASCNSKSSVNGNVTVKMAAATASGSTTSGGRLATDPSARTQGVVILTSVKMNFRDIKFEVDEDYKKSSVDTTYENVKLKGPFLFELLSANTFVLQTISSVSVPNGNYEEIKFKFAKVVSNDAMNGKSISISGTIDGKPFEFWSDTQESLKIDFSDKGTNVIVNSNDFGITIKMGLDQMLVLLQNAIASGLIDKNNNGKIEIDPLDSDGNSNLHGAIKNALKAQSRLENAK